MLLKEWLKNNYRPIINRLYFGIKNVLNSEVNIALHSVSHCTPFTKEDINSSLVLDKGVFDKLILKNISLSFDDGYKDNINALHQYSEITGKTAILFICTRFLEEEPWQFNFDLYHYLDATGASINIEFSKCKDHLKSLDVISQKKWFEERNWTIRENSPIQFMTFAELRDLSYSENVIIALHGHDHVSYKSRTFKDSLEDINKCRELLALNGVRFRSDLFALPYGDIPLEYELDRFKREAKLSKVYGTNIVPKKSLTGRFLYWNESP